MDSNQHSPVRTMYICTTHTLQQGQCPCEEQHILFNQDMTLWRATQLLGSGQRPGGQQLTIFSPDRDIVSSNTSF
jgi:hypothetical protein